MKFLLFLKLPQLLALRIPLALASLQLELLVLFQARLQFLLGVESLLANLFALTAELVQIFHVHLFLLLDERQDVRVELHFNWFLSSLLSMWMFRRLDGSDGDKQKKFHFYLMPQAMYISFLER